jgi:hypothetical protein
MKQRYDFSGGKGGRIAAQQPQPRGKTRITICLDGDLADHFTVAHFMKKRTPQAA